MLACAVVAATLWAQAAPADVGWYLPFQTRVTDSGGSPTTAEVLDFTFRLTEDADPSTPACEMTGGALWSEFHGAVPVVDGGISVLLGANSTLPGLNLGVPLCLGVEADDGSVQVFDRKQRLAPSFFAWNADLADDADTLQGKEAAYFALKAPHQADLDGLQATIDGGGDPQQSFASRIAALQAQIAALPPFPANAGRGACNARIRTNPSSVTLEPYDSARLVIEVEGELLGQTGSLTLDWPDDLKAGDSAALSAPGRFFYLYAEENPVGELNGFLSTSPPAADRTHPDAAYPYPTRYVGDMFVEPDGGQGMVVPVRHDPKAGEYRFLKIPVGEQRVDFAVAASVQSSVGTDVYIDLESVLEAPATPFSELVPKTASAVEVSSRLLGKLVGVPMLLVSDGRLIGHPWNDSYRYPNRPAAYPGIALFANGSPNNVTTATLEKAWLSIDAAAPKIAVGGPMNPQNSLAAVTLAITGWRSLR